jgi:hypothetical protein
LILFGSHARDEAIEHSDLDFLVIEPEVEDVVGESVRLHRTLDGLKVWADIIVRSEEMVRECKDVYGTVINPAPTEGMEIAAWWQPAPTSLAGFSTPLARMSSCQILAARQGSDGRRCRLPQFMLMST